MRTKPVRASRARLASAFLAVALVATACGGDDSDDASGDQPDDSPGEPQRGGTIVIGVDAETDRFDPGNGNIGFPARAVHHLVYGSLTAATPDGTWEPYLAESVTGNEDATVWTVTLREGLVFHDGNPLDAEALKASMDRFRLETLAEPSFTYITAVDVVDPLTVDITLDKPFGVFPQVLADEIGAIVSIDAVEEYGEAYGDHPTGAGPYRVVEYVRDDHLTLERVEDFFMDTRGWADQIIFRPIPDDAGRAAALRAGDVDVITTANPADIASFREDGAFNLYESAFGASGILFNVERVPDIRVREAVAMAIDKQALIDLVWNGVGEPLETPFASDSLWYTDLEYPEYDPEAASDLIAEVEDEDGPVSLSILSPVDETNTNFKLALAEQIRAVGIEVEVVDATDPNDYVNRYLRPADCTPTPTTACTGDYDITTSGVFPLIDPWFEYTRRFAPDSILNGTGFSSDALTEGLLTGEASTDPDERKAAYDVVQQELADNMVQLFVHNATAAVVTSDSIEGFGTLVGPDGESSLGNFPIALVADELWRNDL